MYVTRRTGGISFIYLLWVAFNVVARIIGAAMPVQRALGIKLLEALLVRGNTTVSPDLLAL